MTSLSAPTGPEAEVGETCLYVFGIVDAATAPTAGHLPSVAAPDDVVRPLRAMTHGRVAAVHCEIDPDVLGDLEVDHRETSRLARLARHHDDVVRALAGRGPVLPVRLGTLCADLDCLRLLLDRGEPALVGQLDSVRHRSEWALRVQPPQQRPSTGRRARPTLTSGTDYLLGKAAARAAATEQEQLLSSSVRDVDRALGRLAERAGGPEPYSAGAVVSRTYLVRDDVRPQFRSTARAAVAELRALGCEADVVGPLPPYSFVDLRLEATA